MDGIFFLVLAFLTAFSSIKLSYYGDILSKQSKLGSALIGGMLIASITSLPEFITSISAVLINNPSLSFGDILGSNMFNIFVLAVYNIYFYKKNIFNKVDNKYKYYSIILIIQYILVIFATIFDYLDLVTILLLVMYFIYSIKNIKNNEEDKSNEIIKEKHPFIKFIMFSLLLILLSFLLTIEADKIAHIYPKVSSSSIGAILLGITTSLPEVVTTFVLLKINNIDMAISNILGSNIFNFLVLSLSDFFIKHNHIYNFYDKYSLMYLYGGLIITSLLYYIIFKSKNTLINSLFTIIILFIYLTVWYFQFN